ncbi:DJ-1 protein [Aureobasidium sp. EXF-8845]|nr:DJ-1 protein [Aureobasidium sp. EXF-8846]KAI4799380.1 DJ-1 protein [Aureobasidium sp. EXF-8845]
MSGLEAVLAGAPAGSRSSRTFPHPHEIPDRLVDAADILVLPGGAPGAKSFCQSEEVLRLIREFRNEGKWVAAICAGTTALVESTKSPRAEGEAAKKCKVTSHPSVKQSIVDADWNYADDSERVVIDGKIITSRGPGTALLFSLTIVEMLAGKTKRDEIQGPMICAETL